MSGRFLASSAIRASLVEMLPELNVSDIVPSFGSMKRLPLPSSGSSWGEFPGLIGTTGISDFSSLVSRCCFELRFLRSAMPHVRVVFVFLFGSCAFDARLAQASGLVCGSPVAPHS
jgi:hypothetical protein